MDSLERNDKLLQNTIKYLSNISNLNVIPPAIKCIYSTKAKLVTLRGNVHVAATSRVKETTIKCQRCFLHLMDGPAKYEIKSQEKRSSFARKMLKKIKRDKPMTKYQRKYIQRMNQFNGNQLAITCKFCKKESLTKLEQPKKIVTPSVKKKRRKQLKRKDKSCGLNREILLSVAPKTPESAKKFDITNFTPQETSGRKLKMFKLSKKHISHENLINSIEKKIVSKVDKQKNKIKVKNKSKLKEFLNTSIATPKNSTNLKHFLQSL